MATKSRLIKKIDPDDFLSGVPSNEIKYCVTCGNKLLKQAVICPRCGVEAIDNEEDEVLADEPGNC